MTVGKYYDMEEDTPLEAVSTKPEWHHKNFAYDLAKFIYQERIVEIKHEWKMTSADTADYWAVLVSDDGLTRKVNGWHHYMKLTADHRGLVCLESHIEEDVRRILNWEKNNKRKIEQYHALKAELGL